MRRNQHDAQFGRLDPSIYPGQAEARKPKPLSAESQAEQQPMNQQREQQRNRESPAFSQACFSDELSTRMDAANCVRECDRGQPELVLLCRLSGTSA
jgi:hypothetical protein